MNALRRSLYLTSTVAVSILFLMHCSDSGTGSDDNNDNSNPDLVSTIGPSGGTVESDDGRVTLEFPAGALTDEQPITITAVDREDLGPEFDTVIEEFGFGRAYDMKPDGLVFEEPVTVIFHSEQAITQKVDSVSVGLEYLFVNEEGGTVALDSLTLSIEDETGNVIITGELNHFSSLLKTKRDAFVDFLTFGNFSSVNIGDFDVSVKLYASGIYDKMGLYDANYTDQSEYPIEKNFMPANKPLSVDGNRQLAIGTLPYLCSELGTGVYRSYIDAFLKYEENEANISFSYFVEGLYVQNEISCLSAPQLLSPEDGATISSLEVQLSWQELSVAEYYTLEVVEDGKNFDDEDAVRVRSDDEAFALLSGLRNNTTYKWRVRSGKGDFQTKWSEVWEFRTDFGTETLELEDLKVCVEHGSSSSEIFWNWAIVAAFFDDVSDVIVNMTITLPDETTAEISTSPVSAQLLLFLLDIYSYGTYQYEMTGATYKGEAINIEGENLMGTIEVTADEQNAGECGGE